MKLIPLTRGKFAIVDDEDFEILNQYKWFACKGMSGIFYAIRNEKGKKIWMHRVILNAPDGLDVDHRDRDGLNNTRENLRLATKSQNSANRIGRAKTGFKGVYFHKQKRLFYVVAQANKKRYFCGYHRNIIDAAHAYDEKAKEIHGEFAFLNFPA